MGKDSVEAGEEGGFPFGPAKYSGLSMPVEDGWIGGLPYGGKTSRNIRKWQYANQNKSIPMTICR